MDDAWDHLLYSLPVIHFDKFMERQPGFDFCRIRLRRLLVLAKWKNYSEKLA